jgi:DNA-binding transcriptional regulator YhcF (GntR family)
MSIASYKPDRRVRLATQLEEYIRSGIRRGDLKAGQRLGSAKQLAEEWNTTYGAVRQSLETLAAKGLVERRARAGTFLAPSPEPSDSEAGPRSIIGLLVPDIRMPEHGLVTRCLQDAGQKAGFDVLVSSTDNDRDRYDQSVTPESRFRPFWRWRRVASPPSTMPAPWMSFPGRPSRPTSFRRLTFRSSICAKSAASRSRS